MSTPFLSAAEIAAAARWYVLDASGQVLGRLATKAATLLTGKHKAQYAPFLAGGDHVVIINAGKIRLTGKKLEQKVYRWHTHYPGGLKEVPAKKMFRERPDRAIREAILGMLPKNKLRKRMAKKLRVYTDDTHPHAAQKPESVKV